VAKIFAVCSVGSWLTVITVDDMNLGLLIVSWTTSYNHDGWLCLNDYFLVLEEVMYNHKFHFFVFAFIVLQLVDLRSLFHSIILMVWSWMLVKQ